MKLSRFWQAAGLLYFGIVCAVLVRAAVRYASVVAQGIPTNMPPSRGLLTAPIVGLPILGIALVVEAIIGYFDRETRPSWHFIFIGLSYGSLLALAISLPIGIAIMLVVNPLTVRWLLQRFLNKSSSVAD